MLMQRLNYHSVIDAYGGHGRVALELARQFLFRNVQLNWFPTNFHWGHNGIPEYVKQSLRPVDRTRGGFTWIYAQSQEIKSPKTVRYVVHETEDIPKEEIAFFNKTSLAMCTPSDWNTAALKRRGYKHEAVTLPHGIAPDFTFAPQRQDGKVIFATVGELRNKPGLRKNPYQLVKAFQDAFPNRFDGSVELWIKTQPCTIIHKFDDPRVKVCTEHFDQQGLITWLKQTSVYVNASSGEGWCMPMHESMACGRPFISTNWGGPTQYLTGQSGWFIPHKIVVQPDGTFYSGQRQAEPDFDYLTQLMRWIASDGQVELSTRGAAASAQAHKFSWNTSGAIVYRLCEKYGLLMEE